MCSCGGCNEMGYDSLNELSEANAGRSDGHWIYISSCCTPVCMIKVVLFPHTPSYWEYHVRAKTKDYITNTSPLLHMPLPWKPCPTMSFRPAKYGLHGNTLYACYKIIPCVSDQWQLLKPHLDLCSMQDCEKNTTGPRVNAPWVWHTCTHTHIQQVTKEHTVTMPYPVTCSFWKYNYEDDDYFTSTQLTNGDNAGEEETAWYIDRRVTLDITPYLPTTPVLVL